VVRSGKRADSKVILDHEDIEVFELAYRLHKSVSEILAMEYWEFQGWFEYFKMRPVGWKEDHRTALLMQQQGLDKPPEKIFSSLAAIRRSQEEIPEEHKLAQSLQSSGWLAKLQTHAAKNNIDWKLDDDQVRSEGNGEARTADPE
jgi:hypothetical protein